MEDAFGRGPDFSIGVEEELMILDAGTLDQVGAVDVLLRETEGLELPGLLKTELFASVFELTTPVCATVDEAIASLRELRRAAAGAASANGLAIAAAGSHPFAVPERQPVVQEERYTSFVEYAGVSARRQGVQGLHVHVGMPDGETCWRVLENVLPWLPLVLALSANSPYVGGEATGMMSNRAGVLAELPRSGAPPAFGSYAGWEEWVERLVRLGVTADYTRIWWDVRPHPRLGTLEIRMADQPTSLERTRALVDLVVSLCRTLAGQESGPAGRGDYLQNRWAAARFGPRAELIHPDGSRVAGVPGLAAEVGWPLDPARCEGDDQLASGSPQAAAAWLVEATLG